MSNPEKDAKRQDKSKDPDAPKLDAILPDETASTGEILGQFDEYQKKVESEWESAKSAYHEKIDHIMDDFLKETMPKIVSDDSEHFSSSPKPRSQPLSDPDALTRRLERLLSGPEGGPNLSKKAGGFLPYNKERESGWRAFSDPLSAVRRFRALPFLLLLAAGGIGAYMAVATYLSPAAYTPLPYVHTTGAQVFNEKLYVVDWFRKALYIHKLKRGLPLEAVENIPNDFVTGFSTTEKVLWTINGFNPKILQHTLNPEHDVAREFGSPGRKPIGLSLDGTDLWTADADERVIYRHNAVDPDEILDQFPLPAVTLTAIEIKDNRVWILDGKSREVQAYRLQAPLKLLATLDLDPYLGKAKPTGVYVDKSTVWVVTEGPAAVLKIPARKFKKS